jgi:hypothetical protein
LLSFRSEAEESAVVVEIAVVIAFLVVIPKGHLQFHCAVSGCQLKAPHLLLLYPNKYQSSTKTKAV